MVRYIFVTGAMSGLGKGLVTASIGRILKDIGFRVSLIKIDPYLNIDAGTMSPYEHGEVFVTSDGYEADQDLGLYERFMNYNLSRKHNITSGKVYWQVLKKEREGKYLGKTVQIIPHVTSEIIEEIENVIKNEKSDFCIVEIGGTVGDIESSIFLEAARQISLKKETCFVHVTLVPTLTLDEQKTKLTQHSVQRLREIGIQPNFIVARSKEPLSKKARDKISLFCNINPRNIISGYDVDDIYTIPLNFIKQDFDILLMKFFKLRPRKARLNLWKELIKRKRNARNSIDVGIIGKYSYLKDSYISIEQALKHCEYALSININIDFVEAENIEKDKRILNKYHGIIIPGGFGYRGSGGKLLAIKYTRENNIPFLGLCLGFQLAIIEFARNVLGIKDANSTEFGETKNPVIYLLPGQDLNKLGGTMRLGDHECIIKTNTLAYRVYGEKRIKERHRHRYEFNNFYRERFENAGMIFSGINPKQELAEILELRNHKFFIATQFHPEFKSRLERPSPIFLAFVKACLDFKKSIFSFKI